MQGLEQETPRTRPTDSKIQAGRTKVNKQIEQLVRKDLADQAMRIRIGALERAHAAQLGPSTAPNHRPGEVSQEAEAEVWLRRAAEEPGERDSAQVEAGEAPKRVEVEISLEDFSKLLRRQPAKTMDAVTEGFRAKADKLRKESAKRSGEVWKEWAKESTTKGCRHAHRFINKVGAPTAGHQRASPPPAKKPSPNFSEIGYPDGKTPSARKGGPKTGTPRATS